MGQERKAESVPAGARGAALTSADPRCHTGEVWERQQEQSPGRGPGPQHGA